MGKQVILFGGTNAVQFFDSLISISIDVGGQLNSLAESLTSLSQHSDTKVRLTMAIPESSCVLFSANANEQDEVCYVIALMQSIRPGELLPRD